MKGAIEMHVIERKGEAMLINRGRKVRGKDSGFLYPAS